MVIMKKDQYIKVKWIFIVLICTLMFSFIIFNVKMFIKNMNDNSNNNSKNKDGYEIVYRLEKNDGSKISEDDIKLADSVMTRSLSKLTIDEDEAMYNINSKGNKIYVKVKDVKNINNIRKKLSIKSHYLTFRDTNDNILMNFDVLNVGGAKISQDYREKPAISLSVKNKGKFYEVTDKLSKQQDNLMIIWLDFDEKKDSYNKESSKCGTKGSHCLSSATVSQAFANDVIIQGNFSYEEVKNMVDTINSGTLGIKTVEVSFKRIHYVDNSIPIL